MTRKIKVLGLAFVAVAAMSMAAASAAQAAELHATHNADVVITGQQSAQHKFQITHVPPGEGAGGPSTTCTTATFEGTVPFKEGSQVTAQELTTTATYSGCQAFGLGATVRMNGCKYTITNKSAQDVTTAKTAYVDITGCTAGKQIEVIAGGGGCIVTVPEQHHLQHMVFTNTEEAGKPHHSHANITITGITYQTHGFFCFHNETQTRNDAQYQGQATFRAYKKTGQHQVTEHNHQFEKQTHNNEQVGLIAT